MQYKSRQPIYKNLYLFYKKKNHLLKRYSDDISRRHRILVHQNNKENNRRAKAEKEVKNTRLSIKFCRISYFTYFSVISVVGTLIYLSNLIRESSLFESIAASVLFYFLCLLCLWFVYILWASLVSIIAGHTKFDGADGLERYPLTVIISLLLSPIFLFFWVFIFNYASKG